MKKFIRILVLIVIAINLSSCSLIQNTFKPKTQTKVLEATDSEPAIEIIDDLVMAKGLKYRVLASWQDTIGVDPNSNQKLKFGYDNDFTCFIPLDQNYALFWANHESINPSLISNISEQKKNVGGSLFLLDKSKKNQWGFSEIKALQEKYNRRIDANSLCLVSGPLKKKFQKIKGTLANCGGALTPWGTILSCEENFELANSLYKWNINPEQFGWVLEINPFDRTLLPMKHSALGRFAHENVSITIGKTGKLVVYMGDDAENEHIYKYVSAISLPPTFRSIFEKILGFEYPSQNMQLFTKIQKALRDSKLRAALLSNGKLYVAKFSSKPGFRSNSTNPVVESGSGEWKEINIINPSLAIKFLNATELAIHTREAAQILEATPLDRPEDIEVNQKDKSVYIAFTNNITAGNYHGSIVKLIESGSNPEALNFQFKTFLFGGKDLSCPDNLAFDNKNNLWVTTDIKGKSLYKKPYRYHGSNALFKISLSTGKAERIATAPPGAELSGPSFSTDFKTLFFSVQHPGEDGLESKWQNKKPSVVAVDI